MTKILRKNSSLRTRLGQEGVQFVEHAVESVERLLPHLGVDRWVEGVWEPAKATFAAADRRSVRVVFALGTKDDGRSLSGVARRLEGKHHVGSEAKTIDVREKELCDLIARLTSATVSFDREGARSLEAIRSLFDENVVADYLQQTLTESVDIRGVLRALRQLSTETYENKQLTFGCLVSRDTSAGESTTRFPTDYFDSRMGKRFKALSDGRHTAYLVDGSGALAGLVALGQDHVTAHHWFPAWIEPLAYETVERGALGLALTRQGDVLVLDRGTLRFSYRFGRWRLWNHHHLVEVLKALARTNRVRVKTVKKVTDAVYRAALDVSFRRTGALFVVLRSVKCLPEIVRASDRIGNEARPEIHWALDGCIQGRTVYTLPRAVLADIAGIDGAVVIDASGRILAYGAVLEPKRQPRTHETEGARTKAALAASRLGVAIKVSSDGDITAYKDEEKVFQV